MLVFGYKAAGLQIKMLESRSAESGVYHVDPDSTEQRSSSELIHFALGLLRRHYLVILFCTLTAAGLAAVYLRVTPPTYTARAKVIVPTQTSQFLQQQSIYTDRPVDSAQLESQLQIMQSEA